MYVLLPSMRTGIIQLDTENQDLVGEINLIAEAAERGHPSDVLLRLQEFRDHLTEHFDAVDRYTSILEYPGAGAQARHHAETVAKLDRILADTHSGEVALGEVAIECFHELLGTVVMMDMRFLNWHSEVKREVLPLRSEPKDSLKIPAMTEGRSRTKR